MMDQAHNLLWRPTLDQIANSQMTQFMHWVNERYQVNLQNYRELHQWSVTKPGEFWEAVWRFTDVIYRHPSEQILVRSAKIQESRWFVGAKLNFAENLLRFRDQKIALICHSENGAQQTLTYQELYQQACALAAWFRLQGLQSGDRVVGVLPNGPEAVIAMLATASIGAIWSACSPDFGWQGLLDRFSQITPKILFAAPSHVFNGKQFNHLPEIRRLRDQLTSLEQVIVLDDGNSSTENFMALPEFPRSRWFLQANKAQRGGAERAVAGKTTRYRELPEEPILFTGRIVFRRQPMI